MVAPGMCSEVSSPHLPASNISPSPTELHLLYTWRSHQMETFSALLAICAGNSPGTFSALLAICAGNSPVPGDFPAQRPMTWSFDVFFDLRLKKRLSKQSWGWWFETLSCPLWRHCNVCIIAWYNTSWPSNCRSNILRPRQNGRHFPDDNFKCIFFNENIRISIKIWLKFELTISQHCFR